MTAYVYRCFDSDGRLLYVGCTNDVARRMTQHKSQATWGQYHHGLLVETFVDRATALAAEAEAIRTEAPFFNAQPEHTRLVQENRVQASRIFDRLGLECETKYGEDDEWTNAWYEDRNVIRSCISRMISREYPVVTDATRHEVYLAVRNGTTNSPAAAPGDSPAPVDAPPGS